MFSINCHCRTGYTQYAKKKTYYTHIRRCLNYYVDLQAAYNNRKQGTRCWNECHIFSPKRNVCKHSKYLRLNFLTGPDQVVPADSFICCEPGGHVKLHVQARGVASEPPISVPGLLNRTVARYPDSTALATKKADGKWHKITYK